MRVLLGISCCLDFSKTFLNHRKSYKHLTLQLLDVTFYFTLSAYEPYSIPSSKNCKLLILQHYACKLSSFNTTDRVQHDYMSRGSW